MRIPLLVIGGFLGSGKTTLLNHWLTHTQGRRLAVLVNDFGTLNIDAALIKSHGGDSIALSNGCVCCSIGDDLVQALSRVMDAQPPFDGIVIEASGVADPWRIAQVALADPALALEGVVVLVNASSFAAQRRDALLADSLARQLLHADLIVLNQTDRATAAQLAAAHAELQTLVRATPCLETAFARVDPAALLLPHSPGERHRAEHAHAGGTPPLLVPHHPTFSAWSGRSQQLLTLTQLREGVRALAPELLRLKGWVQTVEHGWTEVQLAGRHVDLRPARTPQAQAAVVAIALPGALPAARLAALFDTEASAPAISGPWVLAQPEPIA